ncbi:aldehyde dehydrogenase family protein [Neobacillus sp. WH10]|uniref:aldehyde dehydrogenase family protein n=1 Tax=Neobacillus sp. WH10 TaxID=3047873 RepID=UPI0024C1FE4E|nr:aldehyde dehydrogenase family protein [Neobacillus sp. WH10]WHY79518.1 aldehyde dehydrogenase family protein [Neobacillus sp. WH10]
MNIIDNDLLSIQEARILVENAREAQKKLAAFPQKKLDEIVERMVEEIDKHARELAMMSSDETDYGKWQDKYVKNKFINGYLINRLRGKTYVGIINDDAQSKTMDIGVPIGVIIALCPATSPASTTIYKALIAIKSGNAIIFSPHPRAKNTISKTLDILIRAAEGYGLPEGALSYLHKVTPSGTSQLMNHDATSLIMNTGVPSMLKATQMSGKPVIYGGNGNGPAFIERTADIKQAVQDIITSKTFDYGVVSAAEQAVVVDRCIASEVKREFQSNGAYFMTEEESQKLGSLFFRSDGRANTEMVGKSAQQLAKQAGFNVPDNVLVLISEQKYVSDTNPYSKEKLCPVLAYYIEDDWMNACEKCIELLISERNGHTLVIHSTDEAVIRQFALKKPVGRVLVNTPATFGSMGATTNLFPAMTLGSGSAGVGITTDNVSPMNLIYIRKVGYGVRKTEEIRNGVLSEEALSVDGAAQSTAYKVEDIELLKSILKNAIEGH